MALEGVEPETLYRVVVSTAQKRSEEAATTRF